MISNAGMQLEQDAAPPGPYPEYDPEGPIRTVLARMDREGLRHWSSQELRDAALVLEVAQGRGYDVGAALTRINAHRWCA
jgi:hypothetical protein